MSKPKELTKSQKETLNKLLLKQKEWERSKLHIKTAKKKKDTNLKIGKG
jgi:hypothetical protein